MPSTLSGHAAITSSSSPRLRRCTVPGRPITITVRRAYAPLFLRLLVLLDGVEQLKMRNTWSYYYRQARMASGTSDHAGYAVDCWSDGIGTHTWPSRMPARKAAKISHILSTFRTDGKAHVFGWGICNLSPGVTYHGPTYSKTVSNDPMHFYIAPGITTKDALEVRDRMGIRPDGTIRK